MKKLHQLEASQIERLRGQWHSEAEKFGEKADYADPVFFHAHAIQEPSQGHYYGVLNTGDGCLMLAHVNTILLPGDHHYTLRCGPLLTCPDLQFNSNDAWTQNRFMTAFSALTKGILLLAHEKGLSQVRIHSPKNIHHHFWYGVLVLFRTEDITVNDTIIHDIEMQGQWAIISNKSS